MVDEKMQDNAPEDHDAILLKGEEQEHARITPKEKDNAAVPLSAQNARWINYTQDRVYVQIAYATGGITNFQLWYYGDWNDVPVRRGDTYCWSRRGTISRCRNPHSTGPGRRHELR